MGPYLSEPNKEKVTVVGEGKNILYAASKMQGNKYYMDQIILQDGVSKWKLAT